MNRLKNLIVEYDPVFGTPVSDGKVEEVWGNFVNTGKAAFSVSTSNFVLRARLAIASDEISHVDITFLFKDPSSGNKYVVMVNRFGAVANWPSGFCDREDVYAEQILTDALRKRKKEMAAAVSR